MLKKAEPADVIGLVSILGCLILLSLGKNGGIMNILLTIVGFYFGQKSGRAKGE